MLNRNKLAASLLFFLSISITAVESTTRRIGTIANQDNSGTAAVDAGVVVGKAVAERFAIGKEEMSVEVEPSVKANV